VQSRTQSVYDENIHNSDTLSPLSS